MHLINNKYLILFNLNLSKLKNFARYEKIKFFNYAVVKKEITAPARQATVRTRYATVASG